MESETHLRKKKGNRREENKFENKLINNLLVSYLKFSLI